MLSHAELEELVDDLESDRVERKPSGRQTREICQNICAFANDLPGHGKPGVVFVGVEDSGAFSDITVTDEMLRNLSDLRSNGNVHPFPTMAVDKLRLKGHDVAVIMVQPSLLPPVKFRGRAYVKVGPTCRVATDEEERRLAERRRAADIPFDARPAPGATPADIDVQRFEAEYLPEAVPRDVLEANRRSTEDRLAALRLCTTEGIPTVTGVLVLGFAPRSHLPGAYVQFLRIDGPALGDPVKDEREFSGPLIDLVREAENHLRVHISTAVDVAGLETESRSPDYPFAAIQQVFRNAILHRAYEETNAPVRVSWFTDRIEILSPGGPFGQVTVTNFGQPGMTDYRNPTLAEAMKALGYVQRFGVGLGIARQELEKNGNPAPQLEPTPENVLVVLRSRG